MLWTFGQPQVFNKFFSWFLFDYLRRPKNWREKIWRNQNSFWQYLNYFVISENTMEKMNNFKEVLSLFKKCFKKTFVKVSRSLLLLQNVKKSQITFSERKKTIPFGHFFCTLIKISRSCLGYWNLNESKFALRESNDLTKLRFFEHFSIHKQNL